MSNNPGDLFECFQILREVIDRSSERDWFLSEVEDKAVSETHYSLGVWIRDEWGLWKKNTRIYKLLLGLGLTHADDMSAFILRSFHRFLNDRELRLFEQVENINAIRIENEKKYLSK